MLTRIITGLGFMLALSAGSAQAQTTLAPGDIVFVTMNTTSQMTGDSYTFLTLVPIASGTQIKFTDRGVNTNGTFYDNCAPLYPNQCAAEKTATWTATSALAAGTLVTITSVTMTDGMSDPGVVTASTGTSDLALSFTSIGDGVTAYQGDDTTHTFLASINLSNSSTGADGFNTTISGTTSCALPTGLVAGTSAIGMFPNSGTRFQNVQYDCSKGTSGTAATLRGWINNRNNWLKQDTTLYGPISCGFTVQTAAVPQISFASSSVTVSEASNATITLNRGLVTNTATSIDVTFTAGSATGGGTDFTSTTQTVTFAANQTTATFTVPITNDSLDEDSETFTMTLVANSSGAQPAAPFSATVTITDNDTSGLAISKSALAVTEGGATDSYTLTLTAQPTANVQLLVNVPDGQANVRTTGTYSSNVNVVFTPSNWNVAQTVSVQAVDDAVIETNPHASSIQHSIALTSDPRYAPLTFPTSSISITENDVTPSVYNFSTASYSVIEGDTAGFSANAMVRVFRSGNISVATTVDLTLADGAAPAATAGVDYNAATITVSFAFGESFKDVNVPVAGDAQAEGNEHIALTLANPSQSGQIGTTQPTAVLTITDDDVAGVSVAPMGVSVTEGGAAASYTLTLTSQPTSNVIIVATPSNSQFTVSPTSLTFTPANWASAQAITVSAVDDSVVEGTGTGNITHLVATADAMYATISPYGVGVTIIDNDVTPAVYDFSADTYSVTEGDLAGFSVNAVVRVNRTGNTAGATSVTVSLAAGSAPAATAGVDFDAAPITVSFADGDTFQEINVPIAGDFVAEGDEHLALSLGGASNAGQIGTTHATATLTIADDDTAGASVTPAHVSIIEGGDAGVYELVLTSQPTDDVTISVTSSMTELLSTPSTVTFTPANWSVPQPVTVTTLDDSIIEATHTVPITFGMASNDLGYDGDGVQPVLVTVTDNDFPMPIYDFSAATFEVTEGAPTNAVVRVLRTSDTSSASSVTVTLADGAAPSATAGVDYDATAITVSFAANESVKDITVPIVNDARHEPTEHVALSLGSPSGLGQIGTTQPAASLAITDDDVVGVSASSTSLNVTEGGATASYSLVLTSEPSADVIVSLAASGADVTLSATALTFTSTTWSTPQTVTVTAVDDDEPESAESVFLAHTVTSADADYDAFAIADVTVGVTDNDTPATLDRLLSFSAIDAGSPIAASPGAKNVLALEALVQVPSSAAATELTALSLSLSHGSELAPPPGGRVFLVLDNDADGKLGAGDSELGTANLDGAAGTVALTFTAPLTLAPGSQRHLLLVYDLPSFPVRAGAPLVLLLAAAAMRRRRRMALALGVFGALLLSNTGCVRATIEVPRSFELRAQVVGATATNGTVITGLPLTVATVTAKE